MRLFKPLILMSIVGFCMTAMAETVYCPDTIQCDSQSCHSYSSNAAMFDNYTFLYPYTLKYPYTKTPLYFSKASSDTGSHACSYVDQEGNLRLYVGTAYRPVPDQLMPGNAWDKTGTYCYPRKLNEYARDNFECPYTTTEPYRKK